MPKTNGNSPKERKLKNGIIAGKSPGKAARDAGYSKKTAAQIAHNVLKKPHIAAAILSASQEAAQKAGVDAFWIAERRREIVEHTMRPGLSFDASGANSALSGLAKMIGCDTEKIEHSGNGEAPFKVNIILNPTTKGSTK